MVGPLYWEWLRCWEAGIVPDPKPVPLEEFFGDDVFVRQINRFYQLHEYAPYPPPRILGVVSFYQPFYRPG